MLEKIVCNILSTLCIQNNEKGIELREQTNKRASYEDKTDIGEDE